MVYSISEPMFESGKNYHATSSSFFVGIFRFERLLHLALASNSNVCKLTIRCYVSLWYCMGDTWHNTV